MSRVSSPRESLASILSVESLGEGEFTARLEDFWGASLGGDALARAALAAAESCEGRDLHSLHACSLRPAPPGVPLTLKVERLGDGDHPARRQVRILRDGLLCQVVASFTATGGGLGYQDVALDADLPAPEDLPGTLETARAEGWADYARGPIEFRRIGDPWPERARGEPCSHIEWVRPRAALPDDPRLHMAALVFLADFYSHWEFEQRVGTGFAQDRFVPLDYALFVHGSPRWDDWWLLRATSQVSGSGRALSRREIYTRKGALLASGVREALIARS